MIRCPACSHDAPDDSRFCPGCGAPLEIESATPTRTSVPSEIPPAAVAPARRLTTDPSGGGRFLPGTVLAGRYRILGLLGRGGMGEVYRADDLKLGQAVALKFLPASVAKDEARLQRFLNEVKIARQISHPGVCRVYDVGEVGPSTGSGPGHHFISMEYVDGEDLASLLRRIGRLPRDKAVQIARQLCAGLAAAHDQGVLHRDLKPANVMIDGRGRAKIADFGLAALAEEIGAEEIGAGTPAYMAPEQLAGKGVSVRSDLYSLGLVLYELFTGQPAFKATTPAELARLQEDSTPTSPTRLVEGLDPTIERAILRCLEKEPNRRPASALAVAASLPGGDPLAAALAAGETPSPEMVAAAPKEGSLRPGVAVACLAGVLLSLAGAVFLSGRVALHRRVPLDKSPEVLADRAREIARELGYSESPVDSAHGFSFNYDFTNWVRDTDRSPRRWDWLQKDHQDALYFWYRQSPFPLVPEGAFTTVVSYNDPPWNTSGMLNLLLDTRGRLTELRAIPPQIDEPGVSKGTPNPDWQTLFEVAGLDSARFAPVEPRWVPFANSDTRAAWEGTFPDMSGSTIRAEAASYKGRVMSFNVIYPWTRANRADPYQPRLAEKAATMISLGAVLVILIAGVLIARRNLRLGRGDPRGANRLALALFTVVMGTWAIRTSHVPAAEEFASFIRGVQNTLFLSGFFWLVYMSLEPYVRRWWPQRIISWSRLLAGDYRDPLVGRDILIGGLVGAGGYVVENLLGLLWVPLGQPAPMPDIIWLHTLLGVRGLTGAFLGTLFFAIGFGLVFLFLLLLLQLVLRREWLAAGSLWILLTLASALGEPSRLSFIMMGLSSALVIFTLVRIGVLALISCYFFAFLCSDYPHTTDFSAWYAGNSIAALLLGLAIAGWGFYTSLAGRPLLESGGILRD